MSSRERMTKVLGCLVLSVTAGAVILRLLQPAPLIDVKAFTLAAAFNPIGQIFDTSVPVQGDRWQYIEIHQSQTPRGSIQSLAEAYRNNALGPLAYHFVITNGRGGPDGWIQVSQQWAQQQSDRGPQVSRWAASAPATIKICLIGDFGQAGPARVQFSQLKLLLRSLQKRCKIPPENISIAGPASSLASQWRLFPVDKLRTALQSNSAD